MYNVNRKKCENKIVIIHCDSLGRNLISMITTNKAKGSSIVYPYIYIHIYVYRDMYVHICIVSLYTTRP